MDIQTRWWLLSPFNRSSELCLPRNRQDLVLFIIPISILQLFGSQLVANHALEHSNLNYVTDTLHELMVEPSNGVKENKKDPVFKQMRSFIRKLDRIAVLLLELEMSFHKRAFIDYCFWRQMVLEEFQKDLWSVDADQRAPRSIGTALTVAAHLLGSVASNARTRGKSPVTFGLVDLVCCWILQGHTVKMVKMINISGYLPGMIDMVSGHGGQVQVVIPRGPKEAKGLLLASIRDPNPVVFFEPKGLHRIAVEEVPEGDYTVPLSEAEAVT